MPIAEDEEIQHEIDSHQGATRLLRDIFDDLERRWRADPPPAPSDPSEAERQPEASLGEVMERLDERAFGLLMLLLAIPTSIPFVYVLPQIVSLPMLALAGQMAAGRQSPWLPRRLSRRRFEIAPFRSILIKSEPYIGVLEKLARPRLTALTGRKGARVIGALMLAPLASVLIPLPGTNAVPAMGVAIASLGLIERDGIIVLLGLAVSFAWIALLLFFGVEAAGLIKAWLGGLF